MGERTKGDCLIRNLDRLRTKESMLRIATAGLYRPDGRKLYRAYPCDAEDDEWGVTPDPKYVLKLPPEERKDLAELLDRQTFILPRVQVGQEDKPKFKDRQLEMALEYLRGAAPLTPPASRSTSTTKCPDWRSPRPCRP